MAAGRRQGADVPRDDGGPSALVVDSLFVNPPPESMLAPPYLGNAASVSSIPGGSQASINLERPLGQAELETLDRGIDRPVGRGGGAQGEEEGHEMFDRGVRVG